MQTIRPYSMLIYGLQDDFISVLKPVDLESKGHVISPKITLKNDGTQELTFSIPMYYTEPETGVRVINQLWAATRNNEWLSNQRKIKIVFPKEDADDVVFEFVIVEKKDSHSKGELKCEIKAEGLAFRELGGTGYKLSLTQDDFLVEYDAWADGDNPDPAEEPVMSINYWCDKALAGTGWEYEIKMDWSAYPDMERDPSKVYEDEYISDWDSNLAPIAIESAREKYRPIDCKDSNRYNITQDIAEAFGVYCRYEYKHNANHQIVGRKVIFYNNFFAEQEDSLDITYPHQTNEVERTIESQDIVTKLYVKDIEDNNSATGIISIADADANLMGEDYILNFDYLRAVGSLAEDQYEYIDEFKKKIREFNQGINQCSKEIAAKTRELNDWKVQQANSGAAIDAANERILEAQMGLSSLLNRDGVLNRECIYVPGVKEPDSNVYSFHITDIGVIAETLKAFSKRENGVLKDELAYSVVTDPLTHLISGLQIEFEGDNLSVWLSYQYRPSTKYDLIIDTYTPEQAKQQANYTTSSDRVNALSGELEDLYEQLTELLGNKQKELTYFERLMGPAIREGNWSSEQYKDYGTRKNIELDETSTDGDPRFMWGEVIFDNEQKNYYESGVGRDKVYYKYIELTDSMMETLQDAYESSSFVSFESFLNSLYFYYTLHYTNAPDNKSDVVIREGIGATLIPSFIRRNGTIIPVLLLNDKDRYSTYSGLVGDGYDPLQNMAIGTFTFETNVETNEDGEIRYVTTETYDDLISLSTSNILDGDSSCETVVPRIEITSLLLKTVEDRIYLQIKDSRTLDKYTDFSLLSDNDVWYITLRFPAVFEHWKKLNFILHYEESNAPTALYLDALEVMKTNAFPQVSYSITPSKLLDKDMIELYKYVNRIVTINDPELFLDQVWGYISEIELSLDKPWEDKITIKDYKTKFEDLFTEITAAAATIKTNGAAYDKAAAAFSVSSEAVINESTMQNTLNRYDLNFAFNQGNLTIDEINGIWATKDDGSGVVAIRGGGIFCANEKDPSGEWIWNTGIIPEGINASLITAGQLDTNLVRIFAGNDLALQLNGQGLYAYYIGDDGYDYNKYVVHNRNGLFFTDNDVDRVAVSWNGLELRNSDNELTLWTDAESGSLVLNNAWIKKGTIEAVTLGNISSIESGLIIEPVNGVCFIDNDGVFKYPTLHFNYAVFGYTPDDSPIKFYVDGIEDTTHCTADSLVFHVTSEILGGLDTINLTIKAKIKNSSTPLEKTITLYRYAQPIEATALNANGKVIADENGILIKGATLDLEAGSVDNENSFLGIHSNASISDENNKYYIFAGANDPTGNDAKFSVTSEGKVHMEGASISGAMEIMHGPEGYDMNFGAETTFIFGDSIAKDNLLNAIGADAIWKCIGKANYIGETIPDEYFVGDLEEKQEYGILYAQAKKTIKDVTPDPYSKVFNFIGYERETKYTNFESSYTATYNCDEAPRYNAELAYSDPKKIKKSGGSWNSTAKTSTPTQQQGNGTIVNVGTKVNGYWGNWSTPEVTVNTYGTYAGYFYTAVQTMKQRNRSVTQKNYYAISSEPIRASDIENNSIKTSIVSIERQSGADVNSFEIFICGQSDGSDDWITLATFKNFSGTTLTINPATTLIDKIRNGSYYLGICATATATSDSVIKNTHDEDYKTVYIEYTSQADSPIYQDWVYDGTEWKTLGTDTLNIVDNRNVTRAYRIQVTNDPDFEGSDDNVLTLVIES